MAEKIIRVVNRIDREEKWVSVNPVIILGEIISSILPDGRTKFKIGNGSTYINTPFVTDSFFTKEELEGLMLIINNMQAGKYSLIQVSVEEPTDLDVSIWYEIEEDTHGL